MNQLVAFNLDGQAYAVRLASTRRVLRAVEATPLPNSPEVVLGVFDMGGVILPVLNMRRRLGLAEAAINLSDQFLVADTATRTVALLVNSVTGIVEKTDEEITKAAEIVPGAQCVEGIIRLPDGLLFIYDLDRFLSQKEEADLQKLLPPIAGTA